jgi:hypothetical protein
VFDRRWQEQRVRSLVGVAHDVHFPVIALPPDGPPDVLDEIGMYCTSRLAIEGGYWNSVRLFDMDGRMFLVLRAEDVTPSVPDSTTLLQRLRRCVVQFYDPPAYEALVSLALSPPESYSFDQLREVVVSRFARLADDCDGYSDFEYWSGTADHVRRCRDHRDLVRLLTSLI